MKTNFAMIPVLMLGAAALMQAQAPAAGPAPTKIATIHVANAIMNTKDGQAAANALAAKFTPKKAELDREQSEIAALRDQLSKGSATMSQEAKDKLMRDVDVKTKDLNRKTEDAQADLDQEQQKIMAELGGKMMAIVEHYATQNGFAVVLDVSNPQTTTVLWASAAVDITSEMIKLYDQAHPGAAPPAATSTAAPAQPKPASQAAAPPAKK